MSKPSQVTVRWTRRFEYMHKLELAEAWRDVLARDEPDTDIINPWNDPWDTATGLEYLFAGDPERMEHAS